MGEGLAPGDFEMAVPLLAERARPNPTAVRSAGIDMLPKALFKGKMGSHLNFSFRCRGAGR